MRDIDIFLTCFPFVVVCSGWLVTGLVLRARVDLLTEENRRLRRLLRGRKPASCNATDVEGTSANASEDCDEAGDVAGSVHPLFWNPGPPFANF